MTIQRTLFPLIAVVVLIGCEETKTQIVEIQIPPPSPPQSTPLVIDVAASQLDGDFLLAGGNCGSTPNHSSAKRLGTSISQFNKSHPVRQCVTVRQRP